MSGTKIPEELKCDHLFLSVGANPLPNWVAARLLLRDNGQIYLVHSRETAFIAREHLGKYLCKLKYRQPVYADIYDSSKVGEIFGKISGYLENIRSGQIGFNYTGGTKAMSVHIYRAIEHEIPKGIPAPIFSYLDSRTMEMRFDTGQKFFAGLHPEASLKLNDLMNMHGADQPNIHKEPIALQVAEALVKLHKTEALCKKWREWIKKLQKCTQPITQTLEWENDFKEVADALADGRPLTISLQELWQENRRLWPFKSAKDMINWLEGKWLESYVVSLIQKNAAQYHVNDYGRSFKAKIRTESDKGVRNFKIEADVAGIRGYQIRFISCYTGHSTQTSTHKLMESFLRARQIGGDEACAALICMSEDPKSIEDDVANAWQEKDRVRVFGRAELQELDKYLNEWFNTGIPS